MPIDELADIPADVRARAARIRLVAFDVDGTLTDGRLHYDADGCETKVFHVHDGLGMQRLQAHGIEIALVSARSSAAVARRATDLGIMHVYQGQGDKHACLAELVRSLGLGFEQVAFVGDDLPDLAPMSACGLALIVANAHPSMADHAHWQTRRGGGDGAAREVCDLLLAAQGKLDAERQHWS
ncbi:MAG TPA: HAD-IIIA family hydrolase [Rhodanobacteraceae bacterium]|nr:HAD-IIIA family hydrolase [Rhodanobacteraceae bacterium]